MTIAKRLKQHLTKTKIDYDVVSHPRTMSSSRTAQVAHVAGDCLAKSIVVHHEMGYVLVVVPSTHRVELATLQDFLGARLGLATENEIDNLFDDCDLGAVPPVGAPYGLETVVDESLAGARDVYFEGGDHKTLVHVGGEAFRALMGDARRGRFSHHV